MKTHAFNVRFIMLFTALWFLSPGLAAAQAPTWAPNEGYSYVTKRSSQQWLIWRNVAEFNFPAATYEHETVFWSPDYANRRAFLVDDESPQYWWSDLPRPYRDTTALDKPDTENFAIGSAEAQKIQTNVWYHTIDLLVDDNPNRTTARVRINGQIGYRLPPLGCFTRNCVFAKDTYGLTLWRAPVKVTTPNGDFAPHYTTATGNRRDTQAREDIIKAAERDVRFSGSMIELWSNLNWDPQWELRRMSFDFPNLAPWYAQNIYQATHRPVQGAPYADPMRFTQYYDPAKQAWTPWYKEGGTQ